MSEQRFFSSDEVLNSKDGFSIKNCLCGGVPKIVTGDQYNRVSCGLCGKECGDIELSEAVASWNRSNTTEASVVKEALRSYIAAIRDE